MDGQQYDLFLALLDDSELKAHRSHLLAAQRIERHQGTDSGEFDAELDSIAAEFTRRREEKELREG